MFLLRRALIRIGEIGADPGFVDKGEVGGCQIEAGDEGLGAASLKAFDDLVGEGTRLRALGTHAAVDAKDAVDEGVHRIAPFAIAPEFLAGVVVS